MLTATSETIETIYPNNELLLHKLCNGMNLLRIYLGKEPMNYHNNVYDTNRNNGDFTDYETFFLKEKSMQNYINGIYGNEDKIENKAGEDGNNNNNNNNISFLICIGCKVGFDKKYTKQRNRNNTKAIIQKWLDCPWQMRRSYFNRKALIKKHKSLNHDNKLKKNKPLINNLCNNFKQYYQRHMDGEKIPVTSTNKSLNDWDNLFSTLNLVKILFDSMYMAKLEGRGKEWAKKGLEKEKSLALRFARQLRHILKFRGTTGKECSVSINEPSLAHH